MPPAPPRSFGAHLKSLREAAGFTQEELATIAGLSVHAVSALERGERRRPHVETVRALSAALDLTPQVREAFIASSRRGPAEAAVDELRAQPLPVPLGVFVDRETDVAVLRDWIADPAVRLITLIGPGGVGKSRLALELAHILAEDSSRRVLFVSLAPIRDSGQVAYAIAEALGLADISAADLPRRTQAACGGWTTWLIVDNFEQLLDAASLLADLLTAAPSLRLLVTSRIPLRVRGEREYPVGPLPLTTDDVPLQDESEGGPAVRLFVERARDVQMDFRLTPTNHSTLIEICRRLDALPLALELAARWVKVLTPADLLGRLERDVLLSPAGPRDLPERQQTMTATVAWSYQLLDAGEQRVFRRLSVLPGVFPIEAAAAVLSGRSGTQTRADEALDAVARLIDKSLVVIAAAAERPLYRMLETVRAYAAHQLAASGEHADAMEGLVSYCLDDGALSIAELVGPGQIEQLERVHHDLDTHRTALRWLVERGRPGDASELVWRLTTFWMIRGLFAEGVAWCEQVMYLPSVSTTVRAKVLVSLGIMLYTRGDLPRASESMEHAFTLAQSAGDLTVTAPAEIMLGHIDNAMGNPLRARERFTRSLDGFRAAAIPWGIGNALTGLAGAAVGRGDTAEAERLLEEATTVLRQAGPWYLTLALSWRASLAAGRGDADAAITLVREILTRARELRDKVAFVYAMVPLAAAAVLRHDYEWAARILGAGSVVAERSGVVLLHDTLRDLHQRTERETRARLDPDRWSQAWERGRTSSIDALLDEIDRVNEAILE
jgi:predicted ATPase/DNA-binding XRE family transcriptional regulator